MDEEKSVESVKQRLLLFEESIQMQTNREDNMWTEITAEVVGGGACFGNLILQCK